MPAECRKTMRMPEQVASRARETDFPLSLNSMFRNSRRGLFVGRFVRQPFPLWPVRQGVRRLPAQEQAEIRADRPDDLSASECACSKMRSLACFEDAPVRFRARRCARRTRGTAPATNPDGYLYLVFDILIRGETLAYRRLTLRVDAMDGRRIDKIRVTVADSED